MTSIEQHEFTWVSGHLAIRIGVTFKPKWHIYDHLEIRSLQPEKAQLPITSTGYLSHFSPIGAIDACGGPVAAARILLEDAASTPEWQDYLVASRQPLLF